MHQEHYPDFIGGLGDSGRATADMAVLAIKNNPSYFRHLLELCFYEPYPASMRASRVIQLFCEKNPEFIFPYLDEVILKISKAKVDGVKRNFLKIIAEFIDFDHVKDNATLLQIVFDWLVSQRETVGIRYYCINICEKFCAREPDLIPEFKASLELCLSEAPAGFCNRALKVLKKL